MKKALMATVAMLGLALVAQPSVADMDIPKRKIGQCNAILAKAMGSFNQIARCLDVAPSCTDLEAQLAAFLSDPDCFTLLLEQELFINTIHVQGQSCNVMSAFCNTIEACFGDQMGPTECDVLAGFILRERLVSECTVGLDLSCMEGP